MEVLELKSCIVCSKPHPSFIKSELQAKLIMSSLLPGSSGSVVFNNQLCMYFISKKLLNFTDDECMRFIAHFQDNPSTGWCQVFCDKCGVYVGQALDLHKKMLMLAGKIDELAITLQSYIKNPNVLACFEGQPGDCEEDEEEEEESIDYGFSVEGSNLYDPPECISLRDELEEEEEDDDDMEMGKEDGKEGVESQEVDSHSPGPPPPALVEEVYPEVEVPELTRDVQDGGGGNRQRSRSRPRAADDSDSGLNDGEQDGVNSPAKKSKDTTPSKMSNSKGSASAVEGNKDSEIPPPILEAYHMITPENIPDDVLEVIMRMQYSDSSSDEGFDGNDEEDKEWKPHVKQYKCKKRSKKARKVTPKKKDVSGVAANNVRKSVRKVKPSLRIRNAVADVISRDSIKSPPRRQSTAGSSTGSSDRTKGEAPHNCTRCPVKYRKPGLLATHLSVHQKCDEMNNEFDCKTCGYPCESEKNLRRHMSRRHQVGPQKKHTLMIGSKIFKCDVCEETFDSFITVSRHRRQAHADQVNVFKCDKCDTAYSSSKRLQNHIMHYHERVPKVTCELCGKGFMKKYELKIHLRSHETKNRSEVCEYCVAYYVSKHKEHQQQHLSRQTN